VSERVVHGFEAIEVEEHHGDGCPPPAAPRDRVLQMLHEQGAVRKSRERVVERQVVKLVPALLQSLGHHVEGAADLGELVVTVHVDAMRKIFTAEACRRFLQALQGGRDRAVDPSRQESSDHEPEEEDRERRAELDALACTEGRDLLTDLLHVQRREIAEERLGLVDPIVEGIETVAVRASGEEHRGLERGANEIPTESCRRREGPLGRSARVLETAELSVEFLGDLIERDPLRAIA
jgi:hypothetical protein